MATDDEWGWHVDELKEEIAHLRKDNSDLLAIIHDLKCDLGGGVEAFEAGRRAGVGETIEAIKGDLCRLGEAHLDYSSTYDIRGTSAYVTREQMRALKESLANIRRLADRPIPHPPHELAECLAKAEVELAKLRAFWDLMDRASKAAVETALKAQEREYI